MVLYKWQVASYLYRSPLEIQVRSGYVFFIRAGDININKAAMLPAAQGSRLPRRAARARARPPPPWSSEEVRSLILSAIFTASE